jgi:hypothetical protein
MAASPAELMHDAADPGREVEIACTECGECWSVHVDDGEEITDDQAECPISDCDGFGEEVG